MSNDTNLIRDCAPDDIVSVGPSRQEMEAYEKNPPRFTHRKTHYKHSFGDRCFSVFNYLFNGFLAFCCFYPFYYIFINTISNNELSKRGKILFFPKDVHFKNYVQALHLDGLLQAFGVSVARTVIGMALTVIVAAFLGYMFTRETLWGRKFWYRFVAITMYFNAGVIPWYLTMMNLKLTNNFWGYIFPTIVAPFYIILCKTFIESLPKELQDAAEIDGAGTLRIFFSIILPVIKPIVATVAIFAAVNQWNSFQDNLLLMTDSRLNTLQLLLYNHIQSASSSAAALNNATASTNVANVMTQANAVTTRMTVTIIVVVPIVLVYPFFQRYFTKGIMIGAVKG